jgi:hypothetical protein
MTGPVSDGGGSWDDPGAIDFLLESKAEGSPGEPHGPHYFRMNIHREAQMANKAMQINAFATLQEHPSGMRAESVLTPAQAHSFCSA